VSEVLGQVQLHEYSLQYASSIYQTRCSSGYHLLIIASHCPVEIGRLTHQGTRPWQRSKQEGCFHPRNRGFSRACAQSKMPWFGLVRTRMRRTLKRSALQLPQRAQSSSSGSRRNVSAWEKLFVLLCNVWHRQARAAPAFHVPKTLLAPHFTGARYTRRVLVVIPAAAAGSQSSSPVSRRTLCTVNLCSR